MITPCHPSCPICVVQRLRRLLWPALLFLVVVALSRCSAAWPSDRCKLERGEWHCNCRPVLRPVLRRSPDGRPPPAGELVLDCNGVLLPFRAVADDVGVPRCQP